MLEVMRLSLPSCCLLLLAHTYCAAADSATSPEKELFFENRIRPLLAERCWDCHNADLAESRLRLDSLQAILDGGDRGPALIPGDAKKSLLMHAVSHSEAELQMPEGDKLSAREIKDLAKWIEEGAIWPGQKAELRGPRKKDGPLFSEEEKNFWAFNPPREPDLPAVQNAEWVKSPIDRFILAKLEAAGLEPAPPADKRSLIRRAYFDLIGLPPTPEQVQAFLDDPSPEAFEKVIEELLTSPRYGERWGRHWLDVARYADSNGLDENWAFEHIYKYRDWVIDAFNEDLPYNTFLTHQLAGDLIEQQPEESQDDYLYRVAAAGFLSLGPKMIADDDPKKKKMDIVDEQLNTVGQTFMAMTIGCARCHDHKFDPIPAWDYYAMAGIFKSTRTMEHLKVVAPVWLHKIKPEGYDKELKAFNEVHYPIVKTRDDFWIKHAKEAFLQDKLVPDEVKRRAFNKDKFMLPHEAEKWVPDQHKQQWKDLAMAVEESDEARPRMITVMAPTEGKPEDLKVSLRGNYLTEGAQTQRQFLRIIEGEEPKPIETKQSGRLELAEWLTNPDHPLTARVMVNRVWRWRFGTGIVATTDNFGRLGERPSHPKLLDWLAVKFVEDGWSIKAMHRRMMLSSTYQMSTQHNPAATDIDPENRLLHRFPRKRLEAEAIRDTILFVSDNLDFTMHGSLMPLKDRAYVTGTGSNTHSYDNNRRSVYQPIYRSAVYDVLTAFDFPDPATPNGDRQESVIAPQALVMMNSPLVAKNMRRIAERLLDDFSETEPRIENLYQRALSRPPTDKELEVLGNFVNQAIEQNKAEGLKPKEAILIAWQSLARIVISSNEFLYLN